MMWIVRMIYDLKALNVKYFGIFGSEAEATVWAKKYYKDTGTPQRFEISKLCKQEEPSC